MLLSLINRFIGNPIIIKTMKKLSILILLFFSFSCSTEKTNEQGRFNFGFEKKDPNSGLPEQWIIAGVGDSNYVFTLDPSQKFEGKYSLCVEAPNTISPNAYGVLAWCSNLDYQGNKITLKAQIKTKGVKGQASLVCLIKKTDGKTIQIGEQEIRIKGTENWQEYAIETAYPSNLNEICIALLLKGGGKAWFDNIEMFIDDKNIQSLDSTFFQSPQKKKEKIIESLTDSIISWKHPLSANAIAKRYAVVRRCKEMLQAPADSVKPDPSATIFPGEVVPTAPRINRTVHIKHTPIPERLKHIVNNLNYSGATNETMYSTGLYAAPGEVVTVNIPENLKGKTNIQIGCHTDHLNYWMAAQEDWRRMPIIVRRDPLHEKNTKIASPFGGLIYVTCPPDAPAFEANITIDHAVAAPYYKLGQTTDEEWLKMLQEAGAPWGELECNGIILTISTENLKKMKDAANRAHTWDVIVNACYDLAQIPTPFFRKQRIVSDVHISGGAMHSGYPIMATHCPSAYMESEFSIADPGKLFSPANGGANWGFFHEIGHNMQNVKDWVFYGTTEVSVNLFTLYIFDQVLGGRNGAHEGISIESTRKMMDKYFAQGAKFSQWTQDPFLGLITFRQLQTDFGWEPFKAVFRRFHEENLKGNNKTYSDQEKINNFVIYFSEATKRNLMPFFETWGIPVSKSVAQTVSAYPKWMPYNFPPKI